MSKTQITAEPGIPQIIITREFDAPRDLVFRAHIEPELLAQWLGPRDLAMTIDRWRPATAAPGGTSTPTRRATPTASTASSTATRRRRPSCRPSSSRARPATSALQTATFTDRGGRTLVRTVSAFQSVEDRDAMVASGMERGVRDSGDRLDELLAKLQAS